MSDGLWFKIVCLFFVRLILSVEFLPLGTYILGAMIKHILWIDIVYRFLSILAPIDYSLVMVFYLVVLMAWLTLRFLLFNIPPWDRRRPWKPLGIATIRKDGKEKTQ